jgi:catechol 2,3-dioxygenase-like lactoylglutathione lyase family enzyme/uncharacterized protein YciI
MANFAVRLVHGPGWHDSRPIRGQDGWDAHAAFMDGLVDDGFIIVGGPVGTGEQTLHVVEAANEAEIRARLAADPWASAGLLRVGTIEPWALWLDFRRSTEALAGPLGTDVAVTHILVVSDPARARDFWVDVLGAELYREYGGTSVVLRFFDTWLLLVSGGGPTADKPTVTFAAPPDPDHVSHAITLRVADCQAAYATFSARGASFLTPPHDWGSEVRCFLRDPDGHLVELSQSTQM